MTILVNTYRTKEEVHRRAKEIEGVKFGSIDKTKKTTQKNYVGDIFEEWFGKEKDSISKPDLGIVELKATPYRKLKRGNKYSAKERLVLNLINYNEIANETFSDSHFLKKNSTLEIAFYENKKNISKKDWSFSDVVLYEMAKNPVDFKIIKEDWTTIQGFVLNGQAEKLSERVTTYLAACTKGKNKKDVSPQPFSNVAAKRRAFSFKQGYMTQMLRNYILGNQKTDSIIKDINDLKGKSLKDLISERLDKYNGRTTSELIKEFDISYNGKAINNILVRNMLGLHKGNSIDLINIDELKKAMYFTKTVQFDEKGFNSQNMSFPAFKFKDICSEDWEDEDGNPSAEINNFFLESTMIIYVFQKDGKGNNIFKGHRFYNIPQKIINGPIKMCWENTKNVLNNGVELTYKKIENGHRITNNLPKKSENLVIHVRPHTSVSSYIKNSYSDELPVKAQWINKPEGLSDKYMTKQCFFLNNTYIKSIVKGLLF